LKSRPEMVRDAMSSILSDTLHPPMICPCNTGTQQFWGIMLAICKLLFWLRYYIIFFCWLTYWFWEHDFLHSIINRFVVFNVYSVHIWLGDVFFCVRMLWCNLRSNRSIGNWLSTTLTNTYNNYYSSNKQIMS